MRRREFITLLGGAAASWPRGARAEQPEPTRRIGVLMNRAADDLEGQAGTAAFQQSLKQLGWSHVRIDMRWGGRSGFLRQSGLEMLATNLSTRPTADIPPAHSPYLRYPRVPSAAELRKTWTGATVSFINVGK
jgi:hypothetical protein